jgi:hypothetical protein
MSSTVVLKGDSLSLADGLLPPIEETHPGRARFAKVVLRRSRPPLFDARVGIVVESESAIKYLKEKGL